MKILTIDPGTSTGYCISNITNDTLEILKYGIIDVDISSEYQGDHCIDLMKKVEDIIVEENIEYIGIEDYFFTKRFATGSNVNAAFRTAIHILSRQKNIPYMILNITLWKKFIAGRIAPTKEQKQNWGILLAKKLFIQEALWNRYKIKFPNHCISSLTKKPIVFRYDIVDAVAQNIYLGSILNAKNVICNIPVPEDVVFSRKTNKLFSYPSNSISS